MTSLHPYLAIEVTEVAEHVLLVRLARPKERNAMNEQMWREIGHLFESLDQRVGIRCDVSNDVL